MMPRRATLTVLVAALLMSGCAARAPLPAAVVADPLVSDVAPAFASAPAVDVQGLAALRKQADVAERAGDWAAAVLAHAGVVSVAPRDLDALIGLAEGYRRVGKPLEAELTWRAARDVDARDGRVVLGFAAFLTSVGRAREALTTLAPRVHAAGLAGTVDPGERTYALAGAAYDRLGDHAAAESIYRRGLRVHKDSVQLRNNLAFSMILQGRPHYAAVLLHDLEKAGLAGPKQRRNLALAWGLAGRADRAAEVAGKDLDAAAVQTNLGYYAWLRELDPAQRRQALLAG